MTTQPIPADERCPGPKDPQTQLFEALDTLLTSDEQWHVMAVPGCLTVTRGWLDGSTDTLIILGVDTAHGVREDIRGRHVWSVRGTVQQIVDAARELAAPFAPGAPTRPIADTGH